MNNIIVAENIASFEMSILNFLLSNEEDVKVSLNILELARLNSVKRAVFLSSVAVYGDEPSQPKSENSQTKPISLYGYEK